MFNGRLLEDEELKKAVCHGAATFHYLLNREQQNQVHHLFANKDFCKMKKPKIRMALGRTWGWRKEI